jgi:hypothetical protein
MEKATLKALNGSIAKWRNIVKGKIADEGSDNCPLCVLFFQDGCRGCPVSANTGKASCDGTPYRTKWVPAAGAGEKAIAPDQIAAAKAELNFLMSLRPVHKVRQSTSMSPP